MNRSRALAAVLLLGPVAARADILPLQGTQSMSGQVEAFAAGQSQGMQAFNMSAPNPIAAWSPPPQHIAVSAGGSAELHADWVSGISAAAVTLDTSVESHTGGAVIGGLAGVVDWDLQFFLKLSITTPGNYLLSGALERSHAGFSGMSAASTLTFGPEGQPPILSLSALPNLNSSISVGFGPTEVFLSAGTYIVQASDTNHTSSFHFDDLTSTAKFSLTVVPAPASVLPALVLLVRRRRHER